MSKRNEGRGAFVPVTDNLGEKMDSNWTRIVPKELLVEDIANYEASGDWLNFDCLCQDKDAPDYEDKPYDFPIQNLGRQRFTCDRCGRQYKLHVEVVIEMYEPVSLRYPNVKDKMPAETLGLRVTED